MKPPKAMRHKAIECALLGIVAFVVFAEGVRFVTSLGHMIGATEAGAHLIVLAGLLTILSLIYGLQPQQDRIGGAQDDAVDLDDRRTGRRDAQIGIALFFGYIVMLSYVDYAIATFIFFALYLRIFGSYQWRAIILASLLVSVGSAYLWHVLGVAMPRHGLSIF